MDETQTSQIGQKEANTLENERATTGNINDRKPTSIIDEANEAAKRLEKANAEQKEILARQEYLLAQQKLGGRSEAGITPIKKEQTPQEYAHDLLHGKIPLV